MKELESYVWLSQKGENKGTCVALSLLSASFLRHFSLTVYLD